MDPKTPHDDDGGAVRPPARSDEISAEVYERVRAGEQFQELRRRYRRFAFPMTVAFLTWYLLYVVLSGWARGFMGTKLFGAVNVALVFGILQFVSTFLIAWFYARHADAKLDPIAAEIRAGINAEVAETDAEVEETRG